VGPHKTMENGHCRKLENMMHSAPVMRLTGGRVVITKGVSRMTLPVREDFFHSAGAMHGALYFLALDNAAFFAVNSLVEDVLVLTVSLTTYITRPVSEGVVTATGKAVYQNRSQFIGESVLVDSHEKEIARAHGIFVRSKIRLSDRIGYQ
jgi:uncharacterized protein (TIGR00369 family)